MYASSMCEGSNTGTKRAHHKPRQKYLSCSLSTKPCYQEMLLDCFFFFFLFLLASSTGEFHSFPNCSHHSQHYLAGSGLLCKAVPRQLRLGTGPLSLDCIRWSLPQDGPLMPLSDVGHWWLGKVAPVCLWCRSGADYRGLPRDFPNLINQITLQCLSVAPVWS